MIRLLLVDDHQIVRAGLRMLFQAEADMTIVGEASSGEEALDLVEQLQPDVVIMDVAMPGMNGIEATRQLRARCPDCAILALTMHEDEQYFFAMLGAGAAGYIPKRAAPDDLVSAVRVVSQGNVFLYASLARYLISDVLGTHDHTRARSQPNLLTGREEEVLTLIAEGYTNRQIADALIISPKTVDRHRENIMTKLNLHNRVELVKYAIEKGIIELDGMGS